MCVCFGMIPDSDIYGYDECIYSKSVRTMRITDNSYFS